MDHCFVGEYVFTQYTRIYIDPVTKEIRKVCSQGMPFQDGWIPLETIDELGNTVVYTEIDFELDTNAVHSDWHGVQEVIRARKIIENFEIIAGDRPALKATADPDIASKVVAISNPKNINESFIKNEVAGKLIAALVQEGTTEKDFLDTLRQTHANTPTQLKDLSSLKLLRLKIAFNV